LISKVLAEEIKVLARDLIMPAPWLMHIPLASCAVGKTADSAMHSALDVVYQSLVAPGIECWRDAQLERVGIKRGTRVLCDLLMHRTHPELYKFLVGARFCKPGGVWAKKYEAAWIAARGLAVTVAWRMWLELHPEWQSCGRADVTYEAMPISSENWAAYMKMQREEGLLKKT